MSGWLNYLQLQVKVRTGLSSGVLAWAIVVAVCGAMTFGFLFLAIGIWLADRYGPLVAALILGAFFLLVTAIALIGCVSGHRRTVERARQMLAVRSNAPWITPGNFAVGMQLGRAIGWRRLVPLIAVGVLAAGLAKDDEREHEDRADERDIA